MQSLQYQFSIITIITIFFILLALFIWWLVRLKRERYWLPILRIMEFEKRLLPKLRITKPPFLSFLFFILSCLIFTFFTMQPKDRVLMKLKSDRNRFHIYCDFSPSVTGSISKNDYMNKVSTLYSSLQGQGQVTISSSHNRNISNVNTLDDIVAFFNKVDFHRSGVRLGQSIRKQMEQYENVDQLIIFSDRDVGSWSGFNWRFLLDKMEVLYVPIDDKSVEIANNIYIDKVDFSFDTLTNKLRWDIDVVRTSKKGEVSGELKMINQGEEKVSVPWNFLAGKNRLTISVDLKASSFKKDVSPESKVISWYIIPEDNDAIVFDNQFISRLNLVNHDALIVSEPVGELFLEDPAYHIEVALSLLGFKVKKLDRIPENDVSINNYSLLVILGGTSGGADSYCPEEYFKTRVSNLQLETDSGSTKKKLPIVWLAPYDSNNVNYYDLCLCYNKLTNLKIGMNPLPRFCEDVRTRDGWIGLLPSLGAKQIGGDVDNLFNSLAWSRFEKGSGSNVLAFTIPLKPMTNGGISYASLPLLVKDLLKWQGLVQNSSKDEKNWPRVVDISVYYNDNEDIVESKIALEDSNVPLSESLMLRIDIKDLPPRWSSLRTEGAIGQSSKKTKDDPLPWIKLCLYGIFLLLFLEGGVKGGRLVVNYIMKQRNLLIFLFAFLTNEVCEGKVYFNLVGYKNADITVNTISREVESRTSIQMGKYVYRSLHIDDNTFSSPWIWSRNISTLLDSEGEIDKRLVFWLKRGGFLIVENTSDMQALRKITEGVFFNKGSEDGWRIIPPDHELMRSFHLLDSLFVCPGKVWRGFHYDGRLAILAIPHSFVELLMDKRKSLSCMTQGSYERITRIFINILMVTLTTDYKKDQIHLPEILKRLR